MRWLALGLLWASAASGAEIIRWMVTDFPPAFIVSGEEAGRGYGDQQIRVLVSLLPEFEHHTQTVTLTRASFETQHSDGVCVAQAVDSPDRRRSMIFSERSFSAGSAQLVTAGANSGQFRRFLNDNGEIRLELLLADDSKKGAISAARYYAGSIQELAAISPAGNIERLMSEPQLFKLLQASRVDYIFASPWEVPFNERQYAMPLTAIPVAGMPSTVSYHVACFDGQLGRKVMSRINRALSRDEAWRSFLEPIRQWWDEAAFAAMMANMSDAH